MEVDECQNAVDECIEKDVRVKSLIEAVRKKVPFNVEVCDCSAEEGVAATFARAYFAAPNIKDLESEEKPRIVMCANALHSRQEVREALRHELVHAFDHCVSQRDLAEPYGLACSEIRAAREAECRDNFHNLMGEIFCKKVVRADAYSDTQDNMICRQLKESCAKHYATLSVRAVFPQNGLRCVREQFGPCYSDFAPFKDGTVHESA